MLKRYLAKVIFVILILGLITSIQPLFGQEISTVHSTDFEIDDFDKFSLWNNGTQLYQPEKTNAYKI